jgi:hypothetical protein
VGPQVLAVVTGLVAKDEIEGAGVVAERAKGDGTESGGRVVGSGIHIELAIHLGFERRLFELPDAGAAPAGYRHGVDEVLFDACDRLEFREEFGGERLEGFLGFAIEDDDFAENAVLEGVARGGKFALLGERATGFAAVGAGSFDLEV